MKRELKKRILSLVILLAFSFCMVACHENENSSDSEIVKEKDKNLYITALNVGDADALVVRFQGKLGLIDTGEEDDYQIISNYLAQYDTKEIDFMLLTHFDKDHIGSAKKVLMNYEVKTIFLPYYEGESKLYKELEEELKYHADVRRIKEETSYDFNSLTLQLFPAMKVSELTKELNEFDNDMSLVSRLTYNQKSFLFAGDIEKARINQILDLQLDLKSDWLKFPHHGRYLKKQKHFLDAVNPRHVVICCSAFAPAEDKTVEMLNQRQMQWMQTTACNIVTVCDGESIVMMEEKP